METVQREGGRIVADFMQVVAICDHPVRVVAFCATTGDMGNAHPPDFPCLEFRLQAEKPF
jgi:hypothetical protein